MNSRLKQFIEYLQISVREFEQKISTSNGTIARFLSKNTSVNSELLSKIHYTYPILNMDWLVTGRGSMIYNGEDFKARHQTERNEEYKTLFMNFMELSSAQKELAGSLMKFYEKNEQDK